MPILRSRTRQAGLLASLIALSLLALPLPTHANPGVVQQSAPLEGTQAPAPLGSA